VQLGAGADVLDRAVLIDHGLNQFVHHVGGRDRTGPEAGLHAEHRPPPLRSHLGDHRQQVGTLDPEHVEHRRHPAAVRRGVLSPP